MLSSFTEPGTISRSSSTPSEPSSLMIRWRYESVTLNPSAIEILATMTAFSPTRADAFWTRMTKEDWASAHTTAVSTTKATTSAGPPATFAMLRSRLAGSGAPVAQAATGAPGPTSRRLFRHREDPDHAALGHFLRPAEEIRQQPLLELRVDAPARHDADVLDAVHHEGARRRDDAGVRVELPQDLPGARVEGAEVPVVRPAREDEPAARGEDPSPAHRVGELVTPRPLTRADVPGLDLAKVLRALVDGEADVGNVDTRPPLPGDVLLDLAFHEPAVVVVGGDEETPHLGVVGRVGPVLAAPERRAKVGAPAGRRHAVGVVARTAGRRVDALEHVLLDVPGGGDEADLVLAALQPI